MMMIREFREDRFDKNVIRRYREKIISGGECRFFLETNISGGCIRSNVGGRRCIKDFDVIEPGFSLELLYQVISGIYDASLHYIFPWEYRVTTEELYADRTLSDIKCRFHPKEIKQQNLPECLIYEIKNITDSLIEELCEKTKPEFKNIIKEVAELTGEKGYGIEAALIGITRLKKRMSNFGLLQSAKELDLYR